MTMINQMEGSSPDHLTMKGICEMMKDQEQKELGKKGDLQE